MSDPAEKSRSVKISLHVLWWVVAASIFLWLLVAFRLGVWSWGLMDDLGYLSRQGSMIQRVTDFLDMFQSQGRILWTAAVHHAVCYKVFAASPKNFFVFRLVELALALGIWGWIASRITGTKIAAPLLMVIALGYRNLYDGVYYLSPVEVPGLIVSGCAVACFLKAVEGGRQYRLFLILGLVSLLMAFLTKEPYIGLGVAVGLALLLSRQGNRAVVWTGIGIIFFSILYAILLKLFVAKGYTSDYVLSSSRVWGNLNVWFQTLVVYHWPWLGAGLTVWLFGNKRGLLPLEQFGVWLGVLSYGGFLLLLLPWAVSGYYSATLGLFFALVLAVFIAPRLSSVPKAIWWAVFVVGIVSSYIGASQALAYHSTYQRDTQALIRWMSENSFFNYELSNGAVVRGNATEPCGTIFQHLRTFYGKDYPPAIFTPSVRAILEDPKTRYYIYGTRWGDQDLRRLKGMWSPMFLSENWILFRRMY